MTPKWQKLASLTQEICTLFGAVFANKRYPFKNIFVLLSVSQHAVCKMPVKKVIKIQAIQASLFS